MGRFSDDLPEKFETPDHTYRRQELDDGRTIFKKDGKFTKENAFTSAYFFARTDVIVPDPETGELDFTEVGVDEASMLGEIANNPEEGETVTVNGVEYTHEQIADAFRESEEQQRDPVRY